MRTTFENLNIKKNLALFYLSKCCFFHAFEVFELK